MPNNASLLAYPDVKEFLERALNSERGVKMTFKTRADAFRFRGRCDSFRKLDRKENLKIYTEPTKTLHGRSVYDVLLIRNADTVVTAEPLKFDESQMSEL